MAETTNDLSAQLLLQEDEVLNTLDYIRTRFAVIDYDGAITNAIESSKETLVKERQKVSLPLFMWKFFTNKVILPVVLMGTVGVAVSGQIGDSWLAQLFIFLTWFMSGLLCVFLFTISILLMTRRDAFSMRLSSKDKLAQLKRFDLELPQSGYVDSRVVVEKGTSHLQAQIDVIEPVLEGGELSYVRVHVGAIDLGDDGDEARSKYAALLQLFKQEDALTKERYQRILKTRGLNDNGVIETTAEIRAKAEHAIELEKINHEVAQSLNDMASAMQEPKTRTQSK